MSVGEILAHLATSPHWAQQCHFVEKKSTVTWKTSAGGWAKPARKSKALAAKEQIVDLLKSNGDAFAEADRSG